jgi:hypothetical protein
MDELVFEFSRDDDNYKLLKSLIGKQGSDVCQSAIDSSWINKSLTSCTIGFARMSPKSTYDRRTTRSKGDTHQIWGFAFGRIDPADQETVDVDLVCSRARGSGTGALLLGLLEEKAKRSGARRARILSLPSRRLQAYYEQMGYVRKVVHLYGSNEKVYEMIKFL